jgi:hypothetical protein
MSGLNLGNARYHSLHNRLFYTVLSVNVILPVVLCGVCYLKRKQKVLERTKSPTSLTLFNNTVLVALFNKCKLRTSVYVVTSHSTVTVFAQWVQTMGPIVTQV